MERLKDRAEAWAAVAAVLTVLVSVTFFRTGNDEKEYVAPPPPTTTVPPVPPTTNVEPPVEGESLILVATFDDPTDSRSFAHREILQEVRSQVTELGRENVRVAFLDLTASLVVGCSDRYSERGRS